MSRPKYSSMFIACVALTAACNNDDAVSAPRAGSATDAIGPVASLGATTTGVVKSGVSLANVCADIKGGTATAPAVGAPLQAWQCHGGANQQFALQADGSVTAYGGQRCLDVLGAKANDGDPVVAWTCHGGTNQKWNVTAAGELRTAVNGKCLDLWGAKGENGAKLVVWSCHGGSNQKWTLPSTMASVSPPITTTSIPGSGTSGGTAELPRTYLSTAMPAVTGRTISVPAGGDLQGALNAAQAGDQVVLAAGATYVGNFVLPVKAGMTSSQWITVRTSGSLPAEGTRVGPGSAAQMPKILTPNSAPALSTAPATQGWRLVGLEIGASTRAVMTYAFVAFGDVGGSQSTLAQVPSRLVLDRSYVHGTLQYNVRRCIALNSAATAIINSYLADCHSNDSDSQAIFGWNGPGPFKIANNHLEGGHEVVFFGGQTPGISGLIPSDIEVRGNHITRPMAWRGVWRAKNLWECKSCQRVLIDGNVLENNWIDAQNGFAVVLQGLSDDNNAPQERVWDVTFRNNIVRNTPSGLNLLSRVAYNGGPLPAAPMTRVTVYNNVIQLNAALSGAGRGLQLLADLRDVTVAQNTFVDPTGTRMNAGTWFDDGSNLGAMVNLRVTNNVFGPSQYSPVMGDGTVGAITTLAKYAPGAVMTGNLLVGAAASQFPAGNYFAGSVGELGFNSATMQLQPSSSLAEQFTATPGANAAAVTTATASAVQ